MYRVELYTSTYGDSSDVDASFFETLEEAESFFSNYNIKHAWDTERRSQPALHCMKYKTKALDEYQEIQNAVLAMA